MEEQTKQQQTWWQKHAKLLMRTGLMALVVVVIVLIILIILGYIFNWDWTGLTATDFTSTPQKTTRIIVYQPGKTLWDWLGLLGVLAIPIVVGFGVAWFTAQQGKVSERENKDNQCEKALQAYIDKMSELLLHEHLSELLSRKHSDESDSPSDIQAVIIARARTATVLRVLDQGRRGSLIRFLSQAGILTKCIEDELMGIDLSGTNLARINLSMTNLQFSIFNGVNLEGADLSGANLRGASLRGAYLNNLNQNKVKVSEELWNDTLQENLRFYFRGANLSGVNLMGADLMGADLRTVDLSEADLRGADLSRANLRGAKITEELEKQAKSLKGATMPDGSKHP